MNINYNKIFNYFIKLPDPASIFSISSSDLKIIEIALAAFAALQKASTSAFKMPQQVFQNYFVTPMSKGKKNPIGLDEQLEKNLEINELAGSSRSTIKLFLEQHPATQEVLFKGLSQPIPTALLHQLM